MTNRSTIRRWIQALLLAAGVSGLTQCVDATGPTGGSSSFGIAPVWSGRASHALGVLDEGGFPLDRVRVILIRPVSDTVKDTTVTFHRADPAIDLPLTVRVGPGETLQAVLQFKSGETLLYEGSATVVTVPLNRPNPTPAQLPMIYVGPGKDAARVSVTPSSGRFSTTANVVFSAAAFDAADASLPGTPMEWTVNDSTMGAFTSPGVFVPSGKSGSVTVTAATPTGVSGSATVDLFAPSVASGLSLVSGDGQTATVLNALASPFAVKLVDQFGDPMPGVTVTWTRLTGAGSLGAATSTTSASGVATAQYTAGGTPGDETIRASVAGVTATVTFTVHAVIGTPAAIAIVSGNAQSDTIFKTLSNPFVVKVTDAAGNAISGATVTWTRTAGFGSPATSTSATNAAGQASLSYRLGDVAGTDTVRASVAGVATPAIFTATAIDIPTDGHLPIVTGFAYLRVSPSPVSPLVGDTVGFTVDSVDAAGNPTPVTGVWASSNPGRGAIDANGRLIVADTGAIIVTATRNGLAGHARVTVLPAPKLTSFTFAPKTLSGVTSSPVTASFTFGAIDAGAGVTSATLTLTGPGGVTRSCTFGAPTTGTARNGVFDCAITFPAGSATGAWHVTSLTINGSITRTYGESVLALFSSTTLTINP
jgi:hypothetical protein